MYTNFAIKLPGYSMPYKEGYLTYMGFCEALVKKLYGDECADIYLRCIEGFDTFELTDKEQALWNEKHNKAIDMLIMVNLDTVLSVEQSKEILLALADTTLDFKARQVNDVECKYYNVLDKIKDMLKFAVANELEMKFVKDTDISTQNVYDIWSEE